ncbi:MAG: hypothetical protein RJB26_916 [Pseudomonadota bacterium]
MFRCLTCQANAIQSAAVKIKRVSYRLPEKLVGRLSAEAKAQRRTRTALLVLALESYLTKAVDKSEAA